ncbi:MAG: class I SAM-dependent methyltransferase [Oligoflexia bacterium]
MGRLRTKLKERLRDSAFDNSGWSFAFNPHYLLRAGLYSAIQKIAPSLSGDILDFGCGSRPYESLFTNADRYVGIDVRTSGHDHSDTTADMYFDGQIIPLADASFDAVVAFEVFEHVFDLATSLREIKRVLRPGGKLLVTVPFCWEEHEMPFDFARYSSVGLGHLLKNNGYQVIEAHKLGSDVTVLFQLWNNYIYNLLFRKIGRWRWLLQPVLLVPTHLLAAALDWLMPQTRALYLNQVVVAEMIS